MKMFITSLILFIASNCSSQTSNLLIKIDSSSNYYLIKKDSTMDFFFIGKDDPSIKTALPKGSFWFSTLNNSEKNIAYLNLKEIDVNQVTDSIVRHSWDFLRRHQFYIKYTLNQETKVYKVIQRADFYSEE